MNWRSRIVGHDSVDPLELTANPKNHRTHPQEQRDVVKDSIAELGFIKSVLVNKSTGFIVDGHERVWQSLDAREADPDVRIDVEYVELTEAEEAKALAILDASTEMAVVDPIKLEELLKDFETESDAIATMLEDLATTSGTDQLSQDSEEPEIKFSQELMESNNYVVLFFTNDVDWLAALSHFKLDGTYSKRANGKPWSKGIGRVVDGGKYITRLNP